VGDKILLLGSSEKALAESCSCMRFGQNEQNETESLQPRFVIDGFREARPQVSNERIAKPITDRLG